MIDTEELSFTTKEDFKKEISDRVNAVRDLLNDIEILTTWYMNDRNMTAEETMEYLKCPTVSSIPPSIPCVRWGRRVLYKLSDVEKFIRSNKKPRNQAKDKELF